MVGFRYQWHVSENAHQAVKYGRPGVQLKIKAKGGDRQSPEKLNPSRGPDGKKRTVSKD